MSTWPASAAACSWTLDAVWGSWHRLPASTRSRWPVCNGFIQYLVDGWATPLKNMSSSIGTMKFPIYGKMPKMATKPPTSYEYIWIPVEGWSLLAPAFRTRFAVTSPNGIIHVHLQAANAQQHGCALLQRPLWNCPRHSAMGCRLCHLNSPRALTQPSAAESPSLEVLFIHYQMARIGGSPAAASQDHLHRKVVWLGRHQRTPKWMVYNGKCQENRWFGVPLFQETSLYQYLIACLSI